MLNSLFNKVAHFLGFKSRPSFVWVATEAERRAAADAPPGEFPREFARAVGQVMALAKAQEPKDDAGWPDEWFLSPAESHRKSPKMDGPSSDDMHRDL